MLIVAHGWRAVAPEGRRRRRSGDGGEDDGDGCGQGRPQRTVHVADDAPAGSAPAVPGWPRVRQLAGRAQHRAVRRAPAEEHHAAQDERAPRARRRDREGLPRLGRGAPHAGGEPAGVGAADGDPGVPAAVLQAQAHLQGDLGAAGARHPAAHADAVRVPGRVADVDRRPGLRLGAQQVAGARRRGRDGQRREDGDDEDDGAQDPSHVRKIPRTRRKFRCGPRFRQRSVGQPGTHVVEHRPHLRSRGPLPAGPGALRGSRGGRPRHARQGRLQGLARRPPSARSRSSRTTT